MSGTSPKIHHDNPWCRLVSRPFMGREDQPYYFLEQFDYVTMVVQRHDGALLLVRQYRPAVDTVTLELPAGMVDQGESPEVTALREIEEEVGYRAKRIRPLGDFYTDAGRLNNRSYLFFADELEPIEDWTPEEGVAVEVLPHNKLSEFIENPSLSLATHITPLLLAHLKGWLK